MIEWKKAAVAAALLALSPGCAGQIRDWDRMVIEEDSTGQSLVTEARSVSGDWEITVPGGRSREYITTDKQATHFSCETCAANSRSYHGLFCAMHEYLDSWDLESGGAYLKKDEITNAIAYPHILYRWYGDYRIMEEICLPNSSQGLVVTFEGLLSDTCRVRPWADMRLRWEVPRPEYRIFGERRNNTLLISRVDDPFERGRPSWIAITGDLPLVYERGEVFEERTYWKDEARKAMGRTSPFSPGALRFEPRPGSVRRAVFVFALGETEDDAVRRAAALLEDHRKLRDEKLARIDWIVRGRPMRRPSPLGVREPSSETSRPDRVPAVPSGGGREERAYRWARASMDGLIMDQRGRGIYAGFHWFPNYWGRDSFICLPGACLATGEYETAREILVSFMQYQQNDRNSSRLGRMPNIVNPDDLQYAGVDGTWWFVRAAWKYFSATGDTDFLLDAWPRIRLAIEGALEKAVDDRGYLTHGDGETWMDAGGERNPYSPRGDRAVEVEALFHHGLLVGAAWARTAWAVRRVAGEEAEEAGDAGGDAPEIGEMSRLADRWTERAARLAASFREDFWWDEMGYLYDHLDRDGTADRMIRPNAILALWVYLDTIELLDLSEEFESDDMPEDALLVTRAQFVSVMDRALETVMLPQGVSSLDPDDPRFHPYHLDLDEYFYDEAYHNGDVWEWLTGPAVTCLVEAGRTEEASRLFAPLVDEILEQACVGSLREIQDGRYTPGKEEFGGATSQAWSLAEFIRIELEVFHPEWSGGGRPSRARKDRGGSMDGR